jgi:hypothetical protein
MILSVLESIIDVIEDVCFRAFLACGCTLAIRTFDDRIAFCNRTVVYRRSDV